MKAGKMLKWLSLALSCVFILNYGAIADQTRVNYSRTESDQIETLVNSLNLKEKIGQMMVVGFPESYSDSLPVGIKEVIDNLKPGGIILFARNTRNPMMMQKLAGALQEASRNSSTIPLFLMADQEGGIVMQVSEKTTVFPGQMAIGATGSSKLAEESAGIMGIEALAMGLNVIYGPVLDVNTEPDNEVIGIRSLGEDSTRCRELHIGFLFWEMQCCEVLKSRELSLALNIFRGTVPLKPIRTGISRCAGLQWLSWKRRIWRLFVAQ